eukprot:COSAG01_NODE_2902_length_6891_cov_3.810218_2_plen_161_part_00
MSARLTVKDHRLVGRVRSHQRARPTLHELLAVSAVAPVATALRPGAVGARDPDRIYHQVFALPFVDIQCAILRDESFSLALLELGYSAGLNHATGLVRVLCANVCAHVCDAVAAPLHQLVHPPPPPPPPMFAGGGGEGATGGGGRGAVGGGGAGGGGPPK